MSSKLSGVKSPDGIYAIKADGVSMNRAEVNGRKIDDGDYVIVDSRVRDAEDGDIVVAIVDGKATIKRYHDDTDNGQIVLMADSTNSYDPIYLDPSDDFTISGKVIAVMKRPNL
jgi:repressor LexA